MKNPLTSFFDRVVIISLKKDADRRERLLQQLQDLGLANTNEVEIQDAIPGQELGHSAWWREGGGAWGCLHSHVRFLQDTWISGADTALVMEDDTVWRPDAFERLCEFLSDIPEDWDQMYLGGQHRQTPTFVPNYHTVYRANSVNRTHCYAVRRRVIPRMQAHILHAPDYQDARKAGAEAHHVDHQLEVAHRRKDWVVYAPSLWLAGQGENQSGINGRWHPDKWWDYPLNGALSKMPVIDVFGNDASKYVNHPHLFFGWAVNDNLQDEKREAKFVIQNGSVGRMIRELREEAFSMYKLPAINLRSETLYQQHKDKLGKMLIPVSEVEDTLEYLTRYPENGIFDHPWVETDPDLVAKCQPTIDR